MKISKKNCWPQSLLLALLIVISVNMYMLFSAKRVFSDLVTEKSPYQDSLKYQEEINAEYNFNQSKINLSFDFILESKDLLLTFSKTQKNLDSFYPKDLRVLALRPDDKSLDSILIFSNEDKDKGIFKSYFKKAKKGLWLVTVRFYINGKPYQYKQRLLI